MGRKTTETDLPQFTDADISAQALAEVRDESNAIAAADAVIIASFDAIKAIGRIETAQFYATIAEKVIAETAVNLKEGKKYKNLPYLDKGGNTRHVAHFDEFCQVFLGKSARRVQELMNNYNTLGPELYEQAENIGFRQRDYNALKALPEDDQKIIAQAIEEQNLSNALDLMQQLAAKHQREKEQLQAQLKQGQEAHQKGIKSFQEHTDSLAEMIKKKDDKINGLDLELDKLRGRNTATHQKMLGEQQLALVQNYTRELVANISATLNSEMVQLLELYDDQAIPQPIYLAIAQSLGLIISAAQQVSHNINITPITELETAAAADPIWQMVEAHKD